MQEEVDRLERNLKVLQQKICEKANSQKLEVKHRQMKIVHEFKEPEKDCKINDISRKKFAPESR